MKHLLLVFITPLLILGCTSQADKRVDNDETNEIEKKGLPIYNLDPDTYITKEFGIFDFVNDDLEIIRLETCLDCFIRQPRNIFIEDDFVLVGSLTGPMKPGEVLLFSRDGEFKHKFGKGGRGPGEHVGWTPHKVRYYQEDSTVMIYWEGGQRQLQLFDLSGNYKDPKDQINIPNGYPKKNVERWSDSIWFVTGFIDWGNRFGISHPEDSIRFALFHQNGDIIKETRRTNFPTLSKNQEKVYSEWAGPYQYQGTWKFNLHGNDTLFSIKNEHLKPNTILADPATEFPLNIKVRLETEEFFMLSIAEPIQETMDQQFWELEYHKVLIDKSSGKVYSVKWRDDVFFRFDNLNSQNGGFGPSIRWEDDRLTFEISAAEWMERAEEIDTSKLRPTIREKLKVLEGIKEDDNPIIFTFTLKDEIDFD